MKIYLGFTVAGNRSSVEAAKRILSVLQLMGHDVLTTHLLRDDAWDADRRVPPEEIFARDMKWLAECDIFIAEVSGSSFGLGFETGYLLGATTKETVLFYDRAVQDRLSLLIVGNGFYIQGHSEKQGRSEGGLRAKSSALDRLTPGFSVITGASWSRRSRNHPCPCKSFCRCNRCLLPCSRPYPCRSSGLCKHAFL